MSNTGQTWSFTNLGPGSVLVWLEPWAEEFVLPAQSIVQLRAPTGCELGEIEQSDDQITVWATAEIVQVFINGELQESASASIPAPSGLTKQMLGVVFEDQPTARLGGAAPASDTRASWLTWLKSQFGL